MRGLWLSGIASVLSVCVSAKALQETAGEEHWKASQQQTRRARPSKPRDRGGEPAYSQDQFVSWNVGPSSLCEIDQMNASAIPIPPPSAHDLAEWISIDWDQEASLVSYRQRKDSQRTIVRQICLMLTFTAALLLCLVVWATGAQGDWTNQGLAAFGFAALFIVVTPLAVLCAWRETPVPRHPVPLAVTQGRKNPDNSTPVFVNARFPSSKISTLNNASTVRDLLDDTFRIHATQVAMQWRTVHSVVAESRTVGTTQGNSRTQLVEKWVLFNQCQHALYHEMRYAMLSAGGGFVAILEDLDRQQLMSPTSSTAAHRESKPHIAMLSESRPELTLAALGCMYHGLTSVQVPFASHATVQRCLETTQCSVLLCEAFNLDQVVDVTADSDDGGTRKCPSLKVVVLLQDRNDPEWQPLPPSGVAAIGQLTQSQNEAARTLTDRGLSIMTWAALHALGETVSPLLHITPQMDAAGIPSPPHMSSVMSGDSMTGLDTTMPMSTPMPAGGGGSPNSATGNSASDAESEVDVALLPSSDVSPSMHHRPMPPPSSYLSPEMVGPDMVEDSSPAFILFTGSATGNARAVTVSHANVLAAVASLATSIPHLSDGDVYLCFNPPSMPLEWNLQLAVFARGGSVAFAHHNSLMRNSKRIPNQTKLPGGDSVRGDVSVFRPSLLFATPAQMDRFAHAWRIQVSSYGALMQRLLSWGEAAQRAAASRGRYAPAWDVLLFARLRQELLGARLRLCISSGGVLLPQTHQFMRAICGCAVMQVYGCAESCGVGSISWPLHGQADSSGPPVACGKYKLVDMPEAQVRVAGKPFPVGEVCLAGGQLGSRYWASAAPRNNIEWLRTGDVGQILGDGSLYILGRKAEVMRLTTGRLVSLARIEAAARSCPWVASVAAYADPARAFAIVLVAPDLLALGESAELLACDSSISLPRRRGGHLDLSMHIVVHSRVVHDFLLQQIQAACRAANMTQHQQPHGIALVPQPWKADSGLVSHTLTPIRHHIAERYAAAIARAYKKSAGNAALAEEAQSSIALEGLVPGLSLNSQLGR